MKARCGSPAYRVSFRLTQEQATAYWISLDDRSNIHYDWPNIAGLKICDEYSFAELNFL
jgi:hypothetical protein